MLTLLDKDSAFPPPSAALREPNGLLAIGGDLSPERLLDAYRQGIFPWYSAGEPILWWSPDPRTVIFPARFHISRSLAKALKKADYTVTFNQAFATVVTACAAPRARQDGTWILPEMRQAYQRLYELGYAVSVEVWRDNALMGGIYGVDLGHIFCGESMFSHATNGSKIALTHLLARLRERDYRLLDCQVMNSHLQRLGAEEISRARYLSYLREVDA